MGMGPELRFARAADGTRIGYAVLGSGPPSMVLLSWGNSIETEWENAGCRATYDELSRRRQIIVVSRRGFGPSQRDVEDVSLKAQMSDIAAVADALDLPAFDLWGFLDSAGPGAAFAAENPGRVSRLVLWQPFVRGRDIMDERAAQSLIDLVRANWTLATRTFANVAFPAGPPAEQDWLANQFRKSIGPEMAARYFEFLFNLDISESLPRIEAPSVVLHRRGQRAIPLAAVRAVAAQIPNARFVTLEGEVSYAWLGDTSYLRIVEDFLDEGRKPPAPAVPLANPDRLSEREIEVLRLVAEGKTNQEIAEALVISLNTVAHHVTNILNKAALSNRTEAAGYAHRGGFV
jgi:DNA-binding NarL/FixJ family response regulator